jgi:hypothetical protein
VPAPQIKIEEIARQFGNAPLKDIKVELQIAKPADAVLKAVENAAQNGQFTILAPPIEFKIKCSYLNQTSEVYNFSTPVTRAILIPEGMDKNQISTGIVVETDGRVRHVPTKVVMTGDRLYAQITSLTNSVYALVSRPRQFRDVSGHWAQTSINNMGSRLIINGTGEGLFTPNAAITRAECAAIVINALGLRESDQTSRFSDIERSEWFYGAVTAAYENGLISGYTDGTFQPGKTISREEAMVIILRAINLAGIDTSMADSDIDQEISKFKDGSRFGNWSRQSAAYCIKHQLMLGSQGMAEPERDITRAEAAVIVMKMLQKTNLI